MVDIGGMIQGALESAIATLLDYLSLHVLLCLVPAFFIAGAMTYFIPKDLITRYMGTDADPKIAYPMATAGGFLLAVCSCTVLPLFVGIWKRGAGLGPAITFLFVAPAINILALTYTGTLIGMDIAIARGVLAIVFAILIGLIMAKVFGKDIDPTNSHHFNPVNLSASSKAQDAVPSNQPPTGLIKLNIILIFVLGICSLLLATLDSNMISIIGSTLFSGILLIELLFQTPALIQTLIYVLGLIILGFITYMSSSKELTLFLWLIYVLMTGTSQITYFTENITLFGIIVTPAISNMLIKVILTGIVVLGLLLFVWRMFERDDVNAWLLETWIFVKSIFPLIISGVIIAGFVKYFLPPEIIVDLVGSNTVLANLIGVLFGVFMYFPTLMEVPIARIFLDLGMARGPLLAYLLADPELSIQSILVTRKYLGDKRNSVYIILVTIFTTISGLIFGFVLGQGIGLW
ncbi:permease [Candidatus Heimdallarchaeota archaeon B3_Heim]|nr:MAG: permease [Candidatus Heimdallarchaeota archaeon B3_Heim]